MAFGSLTRTASVIALTLAFGTPIVSFAQTGSQLAQPQPPQDYPSPGYAPQGYAPQGGYAPPGYPPQGYPPQGQPMPPPPPPPQGYYPGNHGLPSPPPGAARAQDDRRLDELATKFYAIRPSDPYAIRKLARLQHEVKEFRSNLPYEGYNAGDILNDAKKLERRIAAQRRRLEAQAAGGAPPPGYAPAPPSYAPAPSAYPPPTPSPMPNLAPVSSFPVAPPPPPSAR